MGRKNVATVKLEAKFFVDPTEKPVSPENARGADPVPMPHKPTGEQSGKSAAPLVSPARPAAYGGNASGRKLTQHRFPAESAEGKEERRRADAERKQAAREVARKMVEPPALRSVLPGENGAGPAPGADLVAGAIGAVSPAEAPAEFVPWDADTLQELTDEIVEGAEEGRCLKFRGLATENKLSDKLADKIAALGRYKLAVKRTLKKTAPRASANLLNRVLPGSGKYSAEGVLVVALVANFVHGRRQLNETRRIIEEEIARENKKPAATGLNSLAG